jgi:hypothetical protein
MVKPISLIALALSVAVLTSSVAQASDSAQYISNSKHIIVPLVISHSKFRP